MHGFLHNGLTILIPKDVELGEPEKAEDFFASRVKNGLKRFKIQKTFPNFST